jgi:hypothetical protein
VEHKARVASEPFQNFGMLVRGVVVDDDVDGLFLATLASMTFRKRMNSWLNAAEGLFATLTKRRLKRGVFRSIQELKHAIHSFIADTNAKPNPSFGQKTQTRSLPPPSGGTKC